MTTFDYTEKRFEEDIESSFLSPNGGYTKGEKPEVRAVGYDAEGNVTSRGAKKVAPAPKKAESAPKTAAKAPAKKVKVTLKAKRPAPAKKVAVAA